MNNEKAIDLARKLKALADKGVGGEKINAAAQLKKLLKKYGITLQDIEGDKKTYRMFPFKKGDRLHDEFVADVILSVCGEIKFYRNTDPRKYNYHGVDVTDAEYVEIREKIDFYWKAFHEDLKLFYSAFIQKNKLYMKDGKPTDIEKLTKEEIEDLKKLWKMAEGLNEHTMQKKLTEKSKS